MKKEAFQKVYEKIVKPYAESIKKSYEEKFSPRRIVIKDNFTGFYEAYLLQKNMLKRILKGDVRDHSVNGNPVIRLDKHKRAACVVCALISVRLMSFEDVNEAVNEVYLPEEAIRLNEHLAWLCGLRMLCLYMKDMTCVKTETGEPVTISEYLDKGFLLPPAIHAKSYEDSFVRGLFFSNITYGMNPILLANIFFLLESYFYKCHGLTCTSPH